MAVTGRPAALLTNTLRGIRRFRVGRKEDPMMTSESSAKDGQSGHECTKSGIRGRLELADYPSVTGEPVPTREASGPGQRVIQTRAETETGWYDFSLTVTKFIGPTL